MGGEGCRESCICNSRQGGLGWEVRGVGELCLCHLPGVVCPDSHMTCMKASANIDECIRKPRNHDKGVKMPT